MLHLLQPIWLLASAGILIPIAIHLWNVKQGKTLKIGSIELLARTAQQNARSLRFTDIFLLILRCLLIVLLALLLSKPYWQNTARQKGWIVMDREKAPVAYATYKGLIDSLSQAGYRFHLFEKGFRETKLSALLSAAKDTAQPHISYWQLVKEMDDGLSVGMPVYLFTGNELRHFTGLRPVINAALTWKTVGRDTTRLYIANAYETTNDSIAITVGESGAGATNYRLEMLSANQPVQNDVSIAVADGKLQVRYQNDAPVWVDTATMHITLFAGEMPVDARYLQSALQSIQQVGKRKMRIRTVSQVQEIPARQDWLFWLSEQQPPAQVNAKNLFVFAEGNGNPVQSWMELGKIGVKTELYQRVAYKQQPATAVWRDGYGIPLLTKRTNSAQQIYDCYTRFNPSWNELVWSSSFPQVVYELIYPGPAGMIGNYDQRRIDTTQLQLPVSSTGKKITAIAVKETKETEHVLWLIIFVLFVTERIYSFRIKKEKANA